MPEITFPPTGWICPKCGKVFAPFVQQCTSCGFESKVDIKQYEVKIPKKRLLTEQSPGPRGM